mgnify:CR=1 FL=1
MIVLLYTFSLWFLSLLLTHSNYILIKKLVNLLTICLSEKTYFAPAPTYFLRI